MQPELRENRRPAVALVAHEVGEYGGMERALGEIIRRGCAEFDFLVLSNELSPSLRSLVRWQRVAVPRFCFPAKFVAFFALAGLRLARAPADVIHLQGAIVPNRAHIASIQFCHAGFMEATGMLAPPRAPLVRRLNTGLTRLLALAAERWCYRADRLGSFAAVSTGIERELQRHYPGIPVICTPNGVDTQRFRPDSQARRELRLAESMGAEDVVGLFVGGDWDRKGLDVAIESLALAIGQVSESLRLWVVGEGDVPRFRALARRCDVADRVTFFGPRPDTERFYQAADLFLLPTLYEAFPLVALEAAAAGLPLVTTPVNGITDLLGGAEAGIVVRRDPAEVAAAIVRLASDPGFRTRAGAVARSRAQLFSWQRSADLVLELYRTSLARRPTGAPA